MNNPVMRHCFALDHEVPHYDMHKSMSGPQICKACNSAKRQHEHLAKVEAKAERYAEQQSERKAKKRAVAEKEADSLLSNTKKIKPSGVKAWQAIEEFKDSQAMSKLMRGEL
ncbi:hypothetical protein N9878_01090 [bacterium]|nr:hypothetical protein [bacterium]